MVQSQPDPQTGRTHGDTVPASGAASAQVKLHTGTVKAFLTEAEASVETEAGLRVHATQAASCLLAPVIGDRVLVCVSDADAHILAVLDRDTGHVAEVSVPGAQAMTVRSAGTLELNASKVGVAAREISLFARAISQTGEVLTKNFKRILESVVDKTIGARTVTTKAAARTAVIDEVDTVKVGMLVQQVDKVATQNSEISMVTAKQDVRLDATRVSVG